MPCWSYASRPASKTPQGVRWRRRVARPPAAQGLRGMATVAERRRHDSPCSRIAFQVRGRHCASIDPDTGQPYRLGLLHGHVGQRPRHCTIATRLPSPDAFRVFIFSYVFLLIESSDACSCFKPPKGHAQLHLLVAYTSCMARFVPAWTSTSCWPSPGACATACLMTHRRRPQHWPFSPYGAAPTFSISQAQTLWPFVPPSVRPSKPVSGGCMLT